MARVIIIFTAELEGGKGRVQKYLSLRPTRSVWKYKHSQTYLIAFNATLLSSSQSKRRSDELRFITKLPCALVVFFN